MAKTEKKKKVPKEKLTLADNPSLIKAGEEIHLRVLDDFYVEQDLPKWKQFKADWDELKKQLHARYEDGSDVAGLIERLEDPEVQAAYRKRLDSYKKGKKKLDDDRWNIKGKHEKAVAEALAKTVRLMGDADKPKLTDRLLSVFGKERKKKPVSVEVAFADLKSHLLHTTTEDMAKKLAIVNANIKKFSELGQYDKADKLKAYGDQIVEESALVAAGFNKFVTEEMMIDFITKSERGVMVSFLRNYDGNIPDEVYELKKKADVAMIFDNYVIAHYSDIKKAAKKAEAVEKKKEAKKEVEKRRDPILFGIIKESRRLYFVADWIEEGLDDLTLEVMEEALKKKAFELDGPDPTEDPRRDTVGGSVDNTIMTTEYRAYEDYSRPSSGSSMVYTNPRHIFVAEDSASEAPGSF